MLDDLWKVAGKLHDLKGNRVGQLAFDLVHPQRLVFEPEDDAEFRKPDVGWDWQKVCRVVVIEVVDYHD